VSGAVSAPPDHLARRAEDWEVQRGGFLADLDAGRIRAAWPDPAAPGGWRVDPAVRAGILELFGQRALERWEVGPFQFADRASLPLKRLNGGTADPPWRVVPGGTSIRAGAHLEPGVVVMPPSFVNVGAWIGADTMVDSHVLVGSCAQIGARVHIAAGVLIGGVLEPAGARPVIVEDEAFVGGGCGLYEGVLVGRGAVLAAGVVLTGTSRIYDLVRERVLIGTPETPLSVPEMAVVVPGTRPAGGTFAAERGLGVTTALIVKDRDAGTDARVALEDALR
jgi:2,3,4,5-tetrahydropyridine-2-carboxylate N-succinyltransferase